MRGGAVGIPLFQSGHSAVLNRKSIKSIWLAVLMVSMSLSVGIVELHRSPLTNANDVAGVGAGCAFITRASGEAIYVDPVNGSDAWDGTWSCPKATLSDALKFLETP